MTDTGWKNPQTMAQYNKGLNAPYKSCYPFVNIDNVKDGSSDSFADIRVWEVTGIELYHKSPYLYAYNYGFNLPSNATVKKIHFFTKIQQITHPKEYYERMIGKKRYSISQFKNVKLKTGASTNSSGNGNNMYNKAAILNLPYMKWSTEAQTTFSGTPKEWGLTGDNNAIITTINSGNFGIVLQLVGTVRHGWVNPAVASMKMKIEYDVPEVKQTPKCEFTKLTVTQNGTEVKFTNNVSEILGDLEYTDYSKMVVLDFNFYHKGASGETPIITFESKGLIMGATKKAYLEGKYSTGKFTMSSLHCNTDEVEKKYTQQLVVFPGSLLGTQTITYKYDNKTYTLRFNVDDATLTLAEKAKFMNPFQECIVKNCLFYKNQANGIGGAMCISSEFFKESGNIYGIMITEPVIDKGIRGDVKLVKSNFTQKYLLTSTVDKSSGMYIDSNGYLNVGQKDTVYYNKPLVVSENTNITYEVHVALNNTTQSDVRMGILNFKEDGTVRSYYGTGLPSATVGSRAIIRVEIKNKTYKLIDVKNNTVLLTQTLTLRDDNNWYIYFLSSQVSKVIVTSINSTPLTLTDVWGAKDANTIVERSLTSEGKINLGQLHNTGIYVPSGTNDWKLKITVEVLEKGEANPVFFRINETGFELKVNNNFLTYISGKNEEAFVNSTVKTNTLNLERNDDYLFVWYRATNQNLVYREFKPKEWRNYLLIKAGKGANVNITEFQTLKGVTDNSNVALNKNNDNGGVPCHNVAWLGNTPIVSWNDFTSSPADPNNFVHHQVNSNGELVVGHNNYLYFKLPDVKEYTVAVSFKHDMTLDNSWYAMGVAQRSNKRSTYYRISEEITPTDESSQFEYFDGINNPTYTEKDNKEVISMKNKIAYPGIETTIYFIKKKERFAIQFTDIGGKIVEHSWDYKYVPDTKFYVRAYNTSFVITEFTFLSN